MKPPTLTLLPDPLDAALGLSASHRLIAATVAVNEAFASAIRYTAKPSGGADYDAFSAFRKDFEDKIAALYAVADAIATDFCRQIAERGK